MQAVLDGVHVFGVVEGVSDLFAQLCRCARLCVLVLVVCD
jgi:hypothetical protein